MYTAERDRLIELDDVPQSDVGAPNKHYIFTFHDSVFECISREFRCRDHRGTLREALVIAATDLGQYE